MLARHKRLLALIEAAERLARDIHAEGSDPIFAVRELLNQARRQVRERISQYERQENR